MGASFDKISGHALRRLVYRSTNTFVLIYLCLDDVPLPTHDSTRLAIRSEGKTLKAVGEEILHAVAGVPIPQWQYPYNENESI